MRFVPVAILCVSFLAGLSGVSPAETAPKKVPKILFVTQSGGFRHSTVTRPADGSLSFVEKLMTDLAKSSGAFEIVCTQDVAKDLTKDKLNGYDIVMFYTSGGKDKLPIPADALEYLCGDWIKKAGHGFIGVHSATDTLGDYAPYYEMIGGTFVQHPWNANSKVTVKVHEPNHPGCKAWGGDFEITDEIYQLKNWRPENVRVLMSLDMEKTAHKEGSHVPISWVKEIGQGKLFYTSLGHREEVWQNPKYQACLLGAVRWIMGQEPGDAKPNPELSASEELKAAAAKKAGG